MYRFGRILLNHNCHYVVTRIYRVKRSLVIRDSRLILSTTALLHYTFLRFVTPRWRHKRRNKLERKEKPSKLYHQQRGQDSRTTSPITTVKTIDLQVGRRRESRHYLCLPRRWHEIICWQHQEVQHLTASVPFLYQHLTW